MMIMIKHGEEKGKRLAEDSKGGGRCSKAKKDKR